MTAPLDVLRALPHRYPILLVDRVTAWEPGRGIVAVKAVSVNEPAYAGLGRLPESDRLAYPAVLLIESWLQAAAILLTSGVFDAGPDAVPMVGAVSHATPGHPVYPGDVVEHRVRLTRAVADTAIVAGHSVVGETEVLAVERVVLTVRPGGPTRSDER